MSKTFQQAILHVLVLLVIALMLVGCSQPVPTSTTVEQLPSQALLALSSVDSCVSVVDVAEQKLVGEIINPDFKKIDSFGVTASGHIYLPLSTDFEEILNEIVVLDPASNKSIARMTVSQSPYLINMGTERFAVSVHNVIHDDATTDVSVIDSHQHALLYDFRIDGIANDVVVRSDTAYILVEGWDDQQQDGLLIFDLGQRKRIKFIQFPRPRPTFEGVPQKITLSKHIPNRAYVVRQGPATGETVCEVGPSNILQVDLESGSYETLLSTVLLTHPDLVEVSEKLLLASESCYGRGKHLRLIDVQKRQVIQETAVGVEPGSIVRITDSLFAVSLVEDGQVAFVSVPDLEVVSKVPLNCKWPSNLLLRE